MPMYILLYFQDIPTKGLDAWFDLYADKKQKIKTVGQCRLKLELSIKQVIGLTSMLLRNKFYILSLDIIFLI